MIETMYEVIVIGAGHAGCEAALVPARLGLKTLLLTINLDKIALMPCNPAIGGVGKSQLVHEIDAMGGQMAKTAEKTYIQVKTLNKRKGPAVQAFRAQIDKKDYETEMKKVLENTKNLTLRQGRASKVLSKADSVIGIETESGKKYFSQVVIICTGTFLNGRIIIGKKDYPAGRMGEYSATNLTDSLKGLGFLIDRFQTATPPRVDGRTIDYSKTKLSPGEKDIKISFWEKTNKEREHPSYLTYTNKKTHEFIKKNIHQSPIRSGMVNTHGPRHCPSIDRKVINYEEKKKHPVFIEPEGKNTIEMYLQGLTTSMPFEIQQGIINTVKGLENARIARPGYAVEYDYIIPNQLNTTLESKLIKNLFFAGQINGTSGYEEAAAQGFIAGVNAAMNIMGKDPLIIKREDGFIGVMIDDIITKELYEPYRMYTSRAEFRLLLRPDNADLRLTEKGFDIGLINREQLSSILDKKKKIEEITRLINSKTIDFKKANRSLLKKDSKPLKENIRAASFLKRPEISIEDIKDLIFDNDGIDKEILRQVEINIKYKGYIDRQLDDMRKYSSLEDVDIPGYVDYFSIKGLKYEAQEKLTNIRPNTLGQASRIAGISPSDISVLAIVLKLKKK